MKSAAKKLVMVGTALCALTSLYVMNEHKRLRLVDLNRKQLDDYNDDLRYYLDVGYDDEDAAVQVSKDVINKSEQDLQKLESRFCFVLPRKSTQGMREEQLKTLIALHDDVIQDCQQEIDELKAQGFSTKRRRVKDVQDRMNREVTRVAYLEEQLKHACFGHACAGETLEQMVDTQQEISESSDEQGADEQGSEQGDDLD